MFTEPLFKILFPKSKWYPKPKHHQLIHIFLAIMRAWETGRSDMVKFAEKNICHTQISRLFDYLDIIVPCVLNYGTAIRYFFAFMSE